MFDFIKSIWRKLTFRMNTEEKKLYKETYDRVYKDECDKYLQEKAEVDAELAAKKRFHKWQGCDNICLTKLKNSTVKFVYLQFK